MKLKKKNQILKGQSISLFIVIDKCQGLLLYINNNY
jgi:hypothetical protein